MLVLSLPEVQAQKNDIIDNLTIPLVNSKDKKRISRLLELAKSYQNKDQKKTIKYANESLSISKRIGDLLSTGRARILLGDAYSISGEFDISEKHFEKAKDIFSIIKSEKDEARLYGYMGELYLKTNRYDKAEKYYLKGLDLSKKIKDDEAITWAMNNLVATYSAKGEIKKAKNLAFEALRLAELLKDNNLQINLHVKIADLIIYQNGNADKVSLHYDKALEIAESINNPRAISGINIQKAIFLSQKEKYKEAEKYYLDALKICKEKGYYYRIILIYSNFGITSLMRGDYKSSLDYFGKAREVANKTGNKEREARINEYIGVVHIEQGDYQKSIEFLYKSLNFYEGIKDKASLSGIYNNMGEAFFLLNDLKKAEESYYKALKIFKELKLQKGIAISYLNLGRILVKEKRYQEAVSYLKQAYDGFYKLGLSRETIQYYNAMAECMQSQEKFDEAVEWMNKVMEKENELEKFQKIAIESYTRLGTIYFELEEYQKAVIFFQKSLEPSIKMQSRMEIKNNYYWLSKCYEELDEYDKGLFYYKKYTTMNDSIFNINKIKQIADIQIKYDTDKKEKEILLLQKEKEYQAILFNSQKEELYRVSLEKDLETERKERDIIQLEAARRKSRIDQLNMENSLQIAEKEIKSNQLDIQKSQLERELLLRNIAIGGGILALVVSFFVFAYYRQRLKTQKILLKKEIEAINANYDGREKERERIAKELHDGIAGNLAAIKLDLSKLSNFSNSELQKIIQNVDGTYNEVRTLSHDLIPPKILKSPFDKLIKDYLNNLSKTCSFIINNDFYPASRFDQIADKIKIELYRITQELMNNIIKHAKADQVDLQFTMLDKQIKFIIEDNGIGFDSENVSQGIGLRNILSRTKSLRGNMHIDTLINRGTIVEICIPITEK
ncbi:tetratricopeptide repeat protein [Aquimarina sediminis]|uniref:tetratricopeptide repeat protein n=1 Tax=Aquimarina sediminis TaxID=2070536 RepID=UPI000FFEB171|nr:tetratricopeptide repeat protein [Aquimarina sediminis]